MKKFSDISVLILAGQREGLVDPLCAQAGVDRKAIIPILGTPMIDYVLNALDKSGLKKPYYISGFDADYRNDLTQSPSAPGPAGSAAAAIEAGIDYPLLITTCDHALLTPEMLDSFISQAQNSDADFCLGLADKSIIQPAYPNVKRTYLKFNDRHVSGCNLFYLANSKGLDVIRFWRRAQDFRKQPIRLAASVGFTLPIRYLLGQLSLSGAFTYASKKLNLKAKPILIPIAEAAIDVDKPSDLELVELILAARKA